MRTSDWSADLGASDRTADIESRLCCTRHARDATNAIAFPTAALDHPVASANKLLFRLLGGYLDRVRASARSTIVDRVEDYVRGSLPSGHCSIEMCAKKMGTTVRSSEERREGNEWVRPGRSWWSRDHYTKNKELNRSF